MKSHFVIILLFAHISTISAQNLNWEVYNTNNSGIISNLITDIVVDQQNIKWIGTQYGLSKFDGLTFTNFNSANSGLPDNYITCIEFDLQGIMWIGTYTGGLVRFDGINWTVYNTSNSGLPNNYITCVAFDAQNRMWIGTGYHGITTFDGSNWYVYNTSNCNIAGNSVEVLEFDNSNQLWIGHGDRGLSKFDGMNWSNWTNLNSGLPAIHVSSITIDEFGNKWIGTTSSLNDCGLAKFDGANWTIYNIDNSPIPANNIHSIAIDAQNNKWIGTNGGLAKFDNSNWITYNTLNSDIPGDLIKTIAFDADGYVWIGEHSHGAAVLKPIEGNFALQFDGLNDYLDAGSNASLQITGNMTIEAWIKINNLPSAPFAQLVQRVGANNDPTEADNCLFTMAITNTGQISAFHENGIGLNNSVLSARTLPVSNWVYVAIVRNTSNKTYQFFINGIGEEPQSYPNNPSGGTNSKTFIGANPDLPFNGIIDEIRIWDIARTETEILADMQNILNGKDTNLAAYWPFNEGVGLITGDATGNGNTATLVNGPIWVISDISTTIEDHKPGLSQANFILKQNFPNPCNSTTKIAYEIRDAGFVTIKVFNSNGVEIATITDEDKRPGTYEVDFDCSKLASGEYVYTMYFGSQSVTKKFILLR
jgi:hypothetical protein